MDDFDALIDSFAKAWGGDPGQLRAQMAARRQAQGRRVARNNARYYAADARQTPAQQAKVHELAGDGMSQTKLLTRGAEVAVFMQGRKWHNGRLATKLAMVYPDGSVCTTFEKSLSRKAGW